MRGHKFYFLVLGMLAVAGALALPAATWAQFEPAQPGEGEDLGNIFPPVQREYRLALGRAEKAIKEQDYASAVDELTRILNGEDQNDYFLGKPGSADSQTSLKTQALELLGSLPPKGRSLYELKSGHEARNALDTALEKGDIVALTEVARRYFHTQAGYEAAILLGRLNLDRGRPLAAALQFQRVAEVDSAAAMYDPELSLLLATSWLHAQHKELAQQTLTALKQRLPKARVRLGKDEVALFASDSEALPWLEKLVGQGGQAKLLAASEWIMFRGNEARNAATLGSMPLLNYRWSLPVVGDPADQQRVKSATKVRMERNDSLTPAVQPLVVSNYAIFRTPDRVIGADLATGKRIWIFPWDDSSYEKVARASGTAGRSPAVSTREQELHQRLFDDHAFGQLSSDGEQVFVIDEIGLAPMNGQSINPNNFIGRRAVPNQLWSRPFNKLVALDIKRQGALTWIVGGESGMDEPALAGAFFLGPPLALEGRLYLLAEFNGEIRLLCLASKTGSLEWTQTLAAMTEQQPVNGDPLRRLSGATPSFANGVLVCPTSGGAVVAVDLATRTLRWGYSYPRWDMSLAIARFGGFPPRRSREPESESSIAHWIDSTATISDGYVLLTPPESDKLHCLDLLTGQAKWAPQPRGELFYVACVHDGKAVLVGRNQVKAIELASGNSAWTAVIDLAGETPTGRGYYSDHHYYLPVTSSQVLKIDLDKGEVASRVKTEVPLGNLVCYRDDLLSQSGEGVAAFYLTEPLRKRTEELLAKNPADAWALARKGEILLQDGQQREAVDLLRQAHKLSPGDEGTRSMLVRVMLSLLKENYEKHADLADEALQLVGDQPAQARVLSRLRAMALDKGGKHWEAFVAYLEIGEIPLSDDDLLEEVARDHLVRRDRLIAGRLAALYAAADEPTKAKMTSEIQVQRDEALQANEPQALRRFLSQFAFHPLADRAVLALARSLAASNQPLEAELLVGKLLQSQEAEVAGAATAILASIYEQAGFELAAAYYAELASKYADVICQDQKTGKELAAAAVERVELGPYLKRGPWPVGRAEVNVSKSERMAGALGFPDGRFPLNITDYRGAAPRGIRATIAQREQLIQVRNDMGRVLASTSLARLAGGGLITGSPMQTSARLNGHLLLVGISGEVVAINALTAKSAGSDSILWRQEVVPPDPSGRRMYTATQARQPANPLLGPNRGTVYIDFQNQVNLGVVTPLGVCFQRQRQLVCADPLTGKTVWERTLSDAGCDLFGDEERIVVVPPGSKSTDALILSPIDGEILDRRKIDTEEYRWATCGRNVLVFERRDSSVKLQLYDATNQGNGLWKRDVKPGARGTIIDGEELAILEPGGQFTIISLKDGREVLSQKPKDLTHLGDNDLDSIVVLRSRDQYLLLANQRATDIDRSFSANPLQPSGVPAHGQLLAFDRHSGAVQWPVAAYISQHGLVTDQPPQSPVLFFVRRVTTTRAGAQASRNSTSVLAIDKRDGRVVFNDDGFLAEANQCDVLVDRLKNSVTLTVTASYLDRRSVTIELTDQPDPPQPPAQTGSRSSLAADDLAGEVDRAAAEALQAMQREAQDPNRGRMILPARNFRLPGLPPGIPLPR
jgi:outer membrane protein assembly factor BamB